MTYMAGQSVEFRIATINRFLSGPSAAGVSYPELRSSTVTGRLHHI